MARHTGAGVRPPGRVRRGRRAGPEYGDGRDVRPLCLQRGRWRVMARRRAGPVRRAAAERLSLWQDPMRRRRCAWPQTLKSLSQFPVYCHREFSIYNIQYTGRRKHFSVCAQARSTCRSTPSWASRASDLASLAGLARIARWLPKSPYRSGLNLPRELGATLCALGSSRRAAADGGHGGALSGGGRRRREGRLEGPRAPGRCSRRWSERCRAHERAT